MISKVSVRTALLAAIAAGVAMLEGCSSLPLPDMRMGAGPSSTVAGTSYTFAPGAPFNAVDRDIATKVAAKTVYEIEVSKLALDKAMNPGVRDFAQTMVTHHTMMNEELVALMSARGVAPPKGLAPDKTTKLHRLAAVPRSDAFDNGYIRVVGIEDHRIAIAMFEKARREVRDRDLRAFIDRGLTMLRLHLTMAQNVAASMAG